MEKRIGKLTLFDRQQRSDREGRARLVRGGATSLNAQSLHWSVHAEARPRACAVA